MFNRKLKAQLKELTEEHEVLKKAHAERLTLMKEMSDSITKLTHSEGKSLVEKEDLEKRLAESEKEKKVLQHQVTSLQDIRQSTLTTLNAALAEVTSLKEELAKLREDSADLATQVEDLKVECNNYEDELRCMAQQQYFVRNENGTVRWLPAGETLIRVNMDLPAKDIAEIIGGGVTAREVKNKKTKLKKNAR